jgi:tetratricopeptide (TPR) repeat protein
MKHLWSVIVLLFFTATVMLANSKDDFYKHLENSDYPAAAEVIPQLLKDNPDDVELHLMAGDVYMELKEFKKAHDTYKIADDLDRREPRTLRKLACAKSQLNMEEDAIEIMKDLIEDERDDDKNIENMLALARIYLRMDSTDQAELYITKAKRIDDENPQILTALGDLYFAREVYQLAKMNYEKALEIESALIDTRMKLATSYFWLANKEANYELSQELFKKSLKEWNTITQMDPNNAKAQYEQGFIYFLASQYEKSAVSLNNYIRLRPNDKIARWYLAQSLENIGRCDSAISHLNFVMNNIDSVKTKAELFLARCYFDLEDFDSAISTYVKVRQDTTIEMKDIQKLGQAYLLNLDTANAIATWNEAVALDPEQNCKIMDQMGYILQKQKKYADAVAILQKRLETGSCPDDKLHIVYYLIGSSYLYENQPELAIENLVKATEVNNEFYFAMINLGDAYAQLEQYDKADSTFNYVIENADTVDSKFALQNAFSKLAGMKFDNKSFNDVIEVSKKWMESFADSPYPYLYMAISYHNLQDGPNACRYYRKVLEIEPGNTTASKNLGLLQQNGQCSGNTGSN